MHFREAEEPCLGEIQTKFSLLGDGFGKMASGEQVRVVPDRSDSSVALRVEDNQSRLIGYLPQEMASWLVPLLEQGKVWLDSRQPGWPCDSPHVVLLVFLTAKGSQLLDTTAEESRLNHLHDMALQLYQEAKAANNPPEILQLSAMAERLGQQELLPESRLLLALIPGMVREVEATQQMTRQTGFRTRLQQLVQGDPVRFGALSVIPLFWPEQETSPCLRIAQGLANGTVMIENVVDADATRKVRIKNKALQPLIVLRGQELATSSALVPAFSFLVPAKSAILVSVMDSESGSHCGCRLCSIRDYSRVYRDLLGRDTSRAVLRGPRVGHHGLPDDGRQGTTLPALLIKPLVRGTTGQPIALPEDTAGVIVVADGQIVGVDVFDSPAMFFTVWPSLSEAYLRAAVHLRPSTRSMPACQIHAFLDAVAGNVRPLPRPVGPEGWLIFHGQSVAGFALVYADRICHMAACAGEWCE